MTDEHQVRALFTRAAELPDNIQPPVARLVESSRRRRRVQAGLALLGIAATVAGFMLPNVLKGPTGFSISGHSGHPPGPATADQLAHSHWSVLPPSPLGPRSAPILVSTGQQLLEFGGTRNGHSHSDGALFNVGERRWRIIARPPPAIGLNGAVSVWTGWNSHKVFLASGKVAAVYDLVTNRWTTTNLPGPLAGLQLVAPVWTGHDVVLAGDSGSATKAGLAVAAYNVASRSWRMITPRLPARHPAGYVSMVATWHKVILWSFWSRDVTYQNGSGTVYSGVDVLVLRHGKWTATTGHWPQHQVIDGAAFANYQILIPPGEFWCGDCPGPAGESAASFADAGSLALTTIPDSPLVSQPTFQPPIWLWNGYTVLAANETGYSKATPGGRLGGMAAYNPTSRRWHLLPDAPGKPALAAPPIFATQQLLVLTQSGDLLSLGRRA